MSKWSQSTLMIGLGIGLFAIWSGAAPVGLAGDLVAGSWQALWCPSEWAYVGCTGYCASHMNGTEASFQCSDGPYSCYGGWFVGAQYKSDGYTVHAHSYITPCWADEGSPGDQFCNQDLRLADFY